MRAASSDSPRAERITPSLWHRPGGPAASPRSFVRALAVAVMPVALAACGSGGATTPTSGATAVPIVATPPGSGTRYHPMHPAAFGLIYGSGCPDFGTCGCGNAATMADEFTCQLDHLAANDIPVTAYLFDGGGWSVRTDGDTDCQGADCCSWNLGDAPIQQLSRQGVRGLLHYWGGCHTPEQYQRAHDRLGRNLLGFYLDDASSDAELQQVSEFMQSAEPGDWENVAKAYQNREPSTTDAGLSRWANVAYMGDLSYQFSGLKDAVDRMLAKAPYLPAPYAELTGYAYLDAGRPDEEVYFRRLQFGALQPVMAHTPYANSDPWRPEYSASLLQAYRDYAWLHHELLPYFYSAAFDMYETPAHQVVQAGPMSSSLLIGDVIYVPVVTESTRTMTIQLPAGQWIDYWDESRLLSGTLSDYPVPLGREPIFVRAGALVPMDVQRSYTGHGTSESAGSLTVLVYPHGSSSFRYRADADTHWITFTSTVNDTELTLAADSAPAEPVLYRVARWTAPPSSVVVDGLQVTVNGDSGGAEAAQLSSEPATNGSPVSAWFYDAGSQRLIVKVVP
ncbi:MAG TPA: TIM-barrel domain-containing protein [Vicinamibacteria bacterium]|nr:TIM-barrel domain-containing protein [Vicinamibacteria bacterium]